MQPTDDNVLLRQYVENHSDGAFAALVTRHINLVYSVALRHVGDPHHAEEITQGVFIILAKKALQLRYDRALSSWLFEATRLTANNFVRSEARRHRREQEAYMQSVLNESDSGEAWQRIAPLLDTAVAALNQKERRAIVLRFYEGRTLSEVGAALGASEEAARKRVARALEKMQSFFSRRGVDSTMDAIAGAMSANSFQAAPLALAKTVTAAALAKGAATSTSTLTLIKGALKIMAWTKAKTAIVIGVGILFAAGTATVMVKEIAAHRAPSWQEENYDISLLNGLAPQVQILPSPPSTPMHARNGRNGRFIALGYSVPNLLEGAYNVVSTHLILNTPVPEGKYDVLCTYSTTAACMNGMQEDIKKRFGLIGRPVIIETNVLILTVQSPNAAGLRPGTGPFSSQVKPGSYVKHGGSIFTLVWDLEKNLGTVVIDETRLRGKFDIDFKWDSTPDGLKQALRDQLGLELTPAQKPVRFVVVDKAN